MGRKPRPYLDKTIINKIIIDMYEVLLSRRPEEDALAYYVHTATRQGSVKPILLSIINSPEFKGRLSIFTSGLMSGFCKGFFNDTSQYGEIANIITDIVNESSISKTVVEVGVGARECGNSYDLMRWFGWRGVLIEANSALIDRLELDFVGLNKDIINCAVSTYEGFGSFYVRSDYSRSSMKCEESTSSDVIDVQFVNVRRLHNILMELSVADEFDILSLDIEGGEFDVFVDLLENSRFRPRRVIVEVPNALGREAAVIENPSVSSYGYEIESATVANLIFRRVRA